MAVWRRRPTPGLMLHSDQGGQFTSGEWQAFLKAHGMVCSMSRRGNCHDNAVAESFFQLLKRERIKRKIYLTRDACRSDVFDYIGCSTTPSAGMDPTEDCLRYSSSGRRGNQARRCLRKPGRFRAPRPTAQKIRPEGAKAGSASILAWQLAGRGGPGFHTRAVSPADRPGTSSTGTIVPGKQPDGVHPPKTCAKRWCGGSATTNSEAAPGRTVPPARAACLPSRQE